MSVEAPSAFRRFLTSGTARWFALAALVAAVIIAVIIATLAPGAGDDPVAAPTSSANETESPSSPGPSPSAAPEPSESASPGASVSPDGRDVAPAVPIDGTAEVVTGLTAQVTNLEAVEGEARTAGDIAGPSVRVTLVVTNSTADVIDLSTTLTNVYFGADATPAQELPGPGGSELPLSVGPGQSVTAIKIFSIPTTERDDVTIQFDYSVEVPIVAFRGSAPR